MPAAPPAPPSTPTTPTAEKPPGSIPSPGSASPPVVDTEKSPDSYLGEDIIGGLRELSDVQGDHPSRSVPKRDADGKFVREPEKPKGKPAEKPKEPSAPQPPEEPKPGTMRALAKAYDEIKDRRDKEWMPNIQRLDSENKKLKSDVERLTKSQPDTKPLQDQIAAVQKENEQLRQIVRYADYQKSPDFQEKFVKPYEDQWSKSLWEIGQLNITMADGNQRKATGQDVLALMNAPLEQLDELTEQWFPKSFPRVVRHVEKLREMADAQNKALEDAKKGAEEFNKKRTTEAQSANANFSNSFKSTSESLVSQYPKWFGEDKEDAKGNEMLKKGFEFADSVFSANGNLSAEQRASRLAVVRAKAANHDRLVSRLKASESARVELEKKLAQYEESEPPTDPATGEPNRGTSELSEEAELEQMDRAGR